MSINPTDIKKISTSDYLQILKEQRAAYEKFRRQEADKKMAEWKELFAAMKEEKK